MGIAANYAFLLAAGRVLGSEDYGSLAALLGLLAVVLIPAGALQMAVSREISRRLARGDGSGADAFARAVLRLALLATLPILALALVLALPLSELLNIESASVTAIALIAIASALAFPVALGVLQGEQRFVALSAMYASPFLLRLALFAFLVAAGYRLGGAVLATVGAAVGATLVALALITEALQRGAGKERPNLRPFLGYLGPVVVGLVGIALLTHVDVLVVKARFSGEDAGAYAAASAFARVAFFLPAAVLAVLFPRAAARQARGEQTEDILGRSLLATAAFCGALALFYAAAGVGLVTTTFGPEFAEGGEVLAPYALAIGLFSLAYVLVGYHLSRGETRYAWVVGAGVVVQVGVLVLWPSSLSEVVWANVVIGAGLLVAHELFVESSVPALRAGLRHLSGPAVTARRVVPEAVLVLLGATIVVCALFWPVVRHLGSTIIGTPGSDSTGSVAWLWQLRHESGFHLLGTSHHSLTGAPFGWEESNGLNLQWFLPYYPAYLVSHAIGEIAAFNLVVLSGYVLSGAAMYGLTRYLGCAPLVSAWAGLVTILFPWHVARAEHASLLHLEVLVLLLLALIAAARRPSWLRLALVGLATLVCWLTSGYFGLMAVVTTVAFTLGASLLLDRRRGALLVAGATGGALAATALVGVASVLSGADTGAGLDRPARDLSIYALRPLELLVPPAQSLLFGGWVDSFWAGRDHGSNPTETANYLGLITIGLALTWLAFVLTRRAGLDRRRRTATAGLVAALAAGLLFALPSPVSVFGHEFSMPSRLLWEVSAAFRVPSRWDPLLMLTVVALAALGLQAVCTRLAPSRWFAPPAIAVVAAATVLSFLELSTSTPTRFRAVPVPSEYEAVERTRPGILAEYPLAGSETYRFWQRRHGRPLLNGARAETPADQVRMVLLDPADDGTAEALSLLGVSAIALHPDEQVDVEAAPREPTGPGYALVGRFPDRTSVWAVTASPAAAVVTLPAGFAKPSRAEAGFVGYALVSPSGVGLLELRARQAGTIRLVFDAIPPRGGSRELRVAGVEREQSFRLNGRTRLSVPVMIPAGRSQLLVKTDPPATSESDAIVISAPRAQAARGEAELRATPVSSDAGF